MVVPMGGLRLNFGSRDPRRKVFGETLALLMREHPSRAVVVRVRDVDAPELEAKVLAQCWMPFGQRRQICCEQIEISTSNASLVDVPAVQSKGLFVLVHELPESSDLEVTAINFGPTPVNETVGIPGAPQSSDVIDLLNPKAPALQIDAGGSLRLSLGGFEGKALRINRH